MGEFRVALVGRYEESGIPAACAVDGLLAVTNKNRITNPWKVFINPCDPLYKNEQKSWKNPSRGETVNSCGIVYYTGRNPLR
jgi:hypothetical protein